MLCYLCSAIIYMLKYIRFCLHSNALFLCLTFNMIEILTFQMRELPGRFSINLMGI